MGSKRTTLDEARRLGTVIGADWTKLDVEEFRRGMDVEFEHGLHDPQTNITSHDPVTTGRIALAHIREFADYYTRLDRMKKSAKRESPPNY